MKIILAFALLLLSTSVVQADDEMPKGRFMCESAKFGHQVLIDFDRAEAYLKNGRGDWLKYNEPHNSASEDFEAPKYEFSQVGNWKSFFTFFIDYRNAGTYYYVTFRRFIEKTRNYDIPFADLPCRPIKHFTFNPWN